MTRKIEAEIRFACSGMDSDEPISLSLMKTLPFRSPQIDLPFSIHQIHIPSFPFP